MAIRSAKAFCEEVPAAASSSVGSLARCSESHSERDTHRVKDKYQLALPIPRSHIPVGEDSIPILKMTDWAKFIERYNLWHNLCGLKSPDHERCKGVLKRFWERYKNIDGSHGVFHAGIPLECTVPLVLHGDEGRSLRKTAMLVVACHSVLGHGLSTSKGKEQTAAFPQKLNYLQSTWVTRFMNAVLPRAWYSEDDGATFDCFQDVLKAVALDINLLFEHGVDGPHGRHYYAVVRIMGDWPWIQKAGCLSRSFWNVAKRATSGQASKGICHQCMADTGNYAWENFEDEMPPWVDSIPISTSPFWRAPALLSLEHNRTDPAGFFSWDLFHGWHLGSAKVFLGSCIAIALLSDIFEGTMDERFAAINEHYKAYCAEHKLKPYLKKITKEKLSWPATT